MENINKYIEEYSSFSFSERELNEIDCLIFSQLSYNGFEGIIDYNSKATLKECSDRFFKNHSEEEIANLILISNKAAELLKQCAETDRFKDIRVCHYINNINGEIDKQVSAVQFILETEQEVVAFRGTDATVTGLKESAMLSYMFPVPAQIEALHYFQESAMKHGGEIILCGHSKGGNLAVFAAVNCSNSLKKRITGVYEFDSPGFPTHFFDRYDYKEIKSKIHFFTPQSSMIGRMLYHDTQPTIVHSQNNGIKQHRAASWEIEGNHFVRLERYDEFSDLFAQYVDNIVKSIDGEDLELFFDALEYIATSLGVSNFYEAKQLELKKALSIVDSIKTLDEEHNAKFKAILKKISTDYAKLYIKSKSLEYLDKIKPKKSEKEEAE